MAILVSDGRRIRGAIITGPPLGESSPTGNGSPQADTATSSGDGQVYVTGSSTSQADTATSSGAGNTDIKGTGLTRATTATTDGSGIAGVTGTSTAQAETATTGSDKLVFTDPVEIGNPEVLFLPVVPPYTSGAQVKTKYHRELRKFIMRFYATKELAKKVRFTKVTDNYTIAESDEWVIVNSLSMSIITLPKVSESIGRIITVQNVSTSGWPVIQSIDGALINGSLDYPIAPQYAAGTISSDGESWWVK